MLKTTLSLLFSFSSLFAVSGDDAPAVNWQGLMKDLYIFVDFDSPMLIEGKVNPVNLDDAGFVEGRFGKAYYFQRGSYNYLSPEIAAPTSTDAFTSIPRMRVQEEKPSLEVDLIDPSGTGSSDDSDSVDDLLGKDKSSKKTENKKKSLELQDDPKFAKAPQGKIELIEDKEFPGEKILLVTGGRLTLKEQPVNIPYYYASINTGMTASVFVKGEKGTELSLDLAMTPFAGDKAKVKAQYVKEVKEKGGAGEIPELVADASFPQKVKLTGEWQRVSAYVTLDSRLGFERKAAFNIKADSPSPLKFRHFQFENTASYPHAYFAPTKWLPGKKRRDKAGIGVGMPQIKDFPQEKGSISVWLRDVADSNLTVTMHGIFSMTKPWQDGWDFPLQNFNPNGVLCPSKFDVSPEWQHLVISWDDKDLNFYRNGKRIHSRQRGKQKDGDMAGMHLQIGAASSSSFSAESIMDEFSIFKRSLTPEEVAALYARTKPLMAESNSYVASEILCTVFFRNQNNARIILDLFAPKAGELDCECLLGGLKIPIGKLKLGSGQNEIAIPFEPYLYELGKYPLQIKLSDAEGKLCFEQKIDIEIKGRLERDGFKVFSWGGMAFIPMDYLDKVGVNALNVNMKDKNYVKAVSSAGKIMCLQARNPGDYNTTDFDFEKVAENTRNLFYPFRNFHNWSMTLTNTEVYSTSYLAGLKENKKWIEWATKELKFPPAFNIKDAPISIARPKDYKLPEDGIIEEDEAIKTLIWFMNEGMPPYLVNIANAKAIHALSPGNFVWTEPVMSPGMFKGLDMCASWGYEYSEYQVLNGFKKAACDAKVAGKAYMPTLGMCYWPTLMGSKDPVETEAEKEKKKGEDVLDILNANESTSRADAIEAKKMEGKKTSVQITPPFDEMMIKTFIAIGAVPAHDLSLFSIDTWMLGEKSGINDGKDSIPPGSITACVTDPGSGEAYGKRMKETIYPMAMLLRDMPCATPPATIYMPGSSEWTSGQWWGHYHYTQAYISIIGSSGVDFDFTGDETPAEQLKSYRYIFFPMGVTITRKNYAALNAAAKTSTVVVDKHCRQEYPNMFKLDFQYKDPGMREKFNVFLKDVYEKLKPELPAFAEGEKGKVLVFPRIYGGRSYVMAVNNNRTTGPMNEYKKVEWYKPYGAAQKASISLKIPESSVVYDFTTGKRVPFKFNGGRAIIEMDMVPAAGHLFCIYPAEFKEIQVTNSGDFAAGKKASLKFKLTDAQGNPPGGRQLLDAKVKDSKGILRDESGFYVLENGEGSIPLLFTAKEVPGEWQVEIEERSSGLKKVHKFTVK